MQALIRSKSAGITGGRGTAGDGPGRDLLYNIRSIRDSMLVLESPYNYVAPLKEAYPVSVM